MLYRELSSPLTLELAFQLLASKDNLAKIIRGYEKFFIKIFLRGWEANPNNVAPKTKRR